jgi:hypothetical protein
MATDPPVDERENFAWFSNEYAQALQALKTIENQTSTLLSLGGTEDLRTFIEQFIDMATRVKRTAEERSEPYFAEWFDELVQKAEALRGEIVNQ